jgi:hypothetical protein
MEFQFASRSKKPAQRKSSPFPKKSERSPAPPHPVLKLQQTIGNQGVLRFVESLKSQLRCHQSVTPDRSVANAASGGGQPLPASALSYLEPHDARLETSATQLNRVVEDAPASAAATPASGALPARIRATMEGAFGMDFSSVRVHRRPEAAAMNARAYTRGTNIYFAPGQYRPDSLAGRQLLAHELTHVAQQAQGPAKATARAGGFNINDSPVLEREADVLGARAARGERVGPVRSASSVDQEPASREASSPGGYSSLSLRDLAGAVRSGRGEVIASTTVQCSRLLDYADATRPEHDPSRLSDADIQATNEYRAFMDARLVWQRSDHVTAAEALLACRLILRELRAGGHVNWPSEARTYMTQAREQLGTVRGVEAMEDELQWHGQDPSLRGTEFGRWLLSGGAEPDPSTGEMNCWEVVMFNAYRAGFTTRARMAALYTTFAANMAGMSIAAAVSIFENAIRRGREQVYDPGDPDSPRPLAGDLVIFNTVANHAAVATGAYPGGEVEIMSLWTQNSREVFRTTIEDLSAGTPIRFFSVRW